MIGSVFRNFGFALTATVVALGAGFLYGNWEGLFLVGLLGILEVTLSFDNAVVNAGVLERMSPFWQKIFLSIGIIIAVFGMRLLFPLLVVWITAGLGPVEAFELALNPPADGASHFADGSPSYELLLTSAHPQIAAFGGSFLFLLFLNFILDEHDATWISWIERPLVKLGKNGQLDMLAVLGTLLALLVSAEVFAEDDKVGTVMVSGVAGMALFIAVNLASGMFNTEEAADNTVKAVGKAGFFLFLYLEVLDASFSFDGVVGAFAISADPIIIGLGLGVIGAMWVRSLTVYMVRRGTLSAYVYLEHGAFYAIGVLAVIMLITVGHFEVPEVVTGLAGLAILVAAVVHSKLAPPESDEELTDDVDDREAIAAK